MRRLVHLITPGDHYSPRTGSAIPTVVHGLSSHRPREQPRPAVLVAAGTYPERYDSAEVLEYPLPDPHRVPRVITRYADPALGLVGLPRPFVRRSLRPAIRTFVMSDPGTLITHNNPQAVPLVARHGHAGVLYAHNRLLRTYSQREAGRVLDAAAGVVCVSDFLAEDTASRLPGRIADRIAVVRNGVDTRLFRRDRPTGRHDHLRSSSSGE